MNSFKSLENIDSAFKLSRTVMIIVVLASISANVLVVIYSMNRITQAQNQLYILDANSMAHMARATTEGENILAEAKDHLRNFHKTFFDLDPDQQQINKAMNEASYYGDESIVRIYKDYVEGQFFTQLIAGNVHARIDIDSITVNMHKQPYAAKVYAKQSLIRKSTITIRQLITTCSLVRVKRTENNPHGFMIERLLVEDNRDIETIKRDDTHEGI